MSALSRDDLVQMGREPTVFCDRCLNWTRRNYCMDDDQFFMAGHGRACPELSEHANHRSY